MNTSSSSAFPVKKIAFSQKIFWGLGGLTAAMVNAVMILALPIYSVGYGVSATWMGLALAVPRLWDAISDPLIGYWSDETRSRWGRRRPFIFAGAIFTGIFFWIIWIPPAGWPQAGLFTWFLGMSLLFFTAFTVWNIPWTALGLELSPDPQERTTVQVYRTAFASLASFLAPAALPLAFAWGRGDETRGIVWVGLILGLILAGCALPGIFCRERFQAATKPAGNLWRSASIAFRNRPFALLCGYTTLYTGGILAVQQMSYYINIFHVFGDLPFQAAKEAASMKLFWNGMTGAVTGLVFLPLLTPMTARLGKRKTLLLGAALVALATASTWFLFTPLNPWLQVIMFLLFAPGSAIVWCVIPSMIADLCDLDELQTGERREGMYSAIWNWLLKLGAALAMAISGMLINFAGIVDGAGEQTAGAVLNIRLLFAFTPFICILCGIACVRLYRVTEREIEEARVQLMRREPQHETAT